MRPISVPVGPLAAASATAIALSQSLAAAGPLTLNGALVVGGVAIMDKPRRVVLTSAGNDSAKTWTIVGTNWSGGQISETLAGGNIAAVTSALSYATVTSITLSAASASTVTAGTSAVADSPWVRLDEWADAPVGVQLSVSGTVNITPWHSFDDPNDLINPVPVGSMFWDTGLIPTAIAGGTAAGASFSIATAPVWMKLTLNSGAGSGKMVVTQYQGGEE